MIAPAVGSVKYANESTSQRANDVQPYRTYRDFLSPWMMGPWAHIYRRRQRVTTRTPFPGIECVLCVVPQCEPRRLDATSTVHSPQSTVQGSESSPPNREAGKSLRRNPDAVTSCEHAHSPNIAPESPWPLAHRAAGTKHQTPCSESHSQLSSRKSDTTPRCSHTQRKFVLSHPRIYRLDLDLNLRLNWPGQCTVTGDRCTVKPSILRCVASRSVLPVDIGRRAPWLTRMYVCMLGMRIGP